jgi:HEAT repeat protein
MKHEIARLMLRALWPTLLLAAVFGLGTRAARAQDPVEDLREHLRRSFPTGGVGDDVAAELLEFRKSKAQEAIDRMKAPGQLRSALVLDEWKVSNDRTINDSIRKVDLDLRRIVGERLQKALEKLAQHANATARMSVATMIAEMGPTVRSVNPADSAGYTRSLAPILEKLCQDPDLGVREQALRAISNINGPPKEVAEVFRAALKDKDVGPRRLAADGLQQLMKVTAHLFSRQSAPSGVVANRKDVLDVLAAIAPVAAEAIKDSDSQVRMLALQGVQAAGQALAELLEAPIIRADVDASKVVIPSRRNFPPPGRQLTPLEVARVLDEYKLAEEDLKSVKPLIESLRKEVVNYAQALRDPDALVRLAASQAFESFANARLRMVRRANTLPTLQDKATGKEYSPANLLKEADFLQPLLDKEMPRVIELLRDPDVRIRRTVANALEQLEEKAAPAMAGLILALEKDWDRSVRWTAAKTLGYMPIESAGPAIKPLAKALSDPDLNVKIVAAASLEALGPAAKDAVPALGQALKSGDVEARLAIMYALNRVGPANIITAVPSLIHCLGDRDPRIVRAASEVLAEIGPAAAAALPALRRLLGHEAAEVRQGASDAILSILRQPD